MSATYNVNHYQSISKAEPKHFWFRARNDMLKALINTCVPVQARKSFLEIGCGTGIVLETLTRLGYAVTGLDVNRTALQYSKAKHTGAKLICQSFYAFRSKRKFQNIGAFDVLEHQTKDRLFLKRCYDMLDTGGYLFLTVPAGMWLWSTIDTLSGHKRRYEKEDLHEKLRGAGFRIVFSNYWSVFTLPWYMLFRLISMQRKSATTLDRYLRIPNAFTNTFLYRLLRLEHLFFFKLRFPVGATLVICAKK